MKNPTVTVQDLESLHFNIFLGCYDIKTSSYTMHKGRKLSLNIIYDWFKGRVSVPIPIYQELRRTTDYLTINNQRSIKFLLKTSNLSLDKMKEEKTLKDQYHLPTKEKFYSNHLMKFTTKY